MVYHRHDRVLFEKALHAVTWEKGEQGSYKVLWTGHEKRSSNYRVPMGVIPHTYGRH